jgi:hypothetical protein
LWGGAILATLFDDVGGAELQGEPLAGPVAARDDDPAGVQLLAATSITKRSISPPTSG